MVVVIIVVGTEIAKSQKVGVGQSALCHQMSESHEKLSCLLQIAYDGKIVHFY